MIWKSGIHNHSDFMNEQQQTTELLKKLSEQLNNSASAQPWSPELVMTLSISFLVFGLLLCLMIGWLIYKDKNAYQMIQAFSLPLIIVSAVVLVVAGFSDRQIAPVIGLLGTIAGYLLGSRRKDDSEDAGKPSGAPPRI